MRPATTQRRRARALGIATALPFALALHTSAAIQPALAQATAAPHAELPSGIPEVPRVLTLPAALALAASHNPSLAGGTWRVRAALARALDAGRRPNPMLEADAENWGGALGTRRMETTLGLSQTLEVGGDGAARTGLARAEIARARVELTREARDVWAGVTVDYVEAWAAQERARRLREGRRIAEDVVAASIERTKAGAASPVERIRAEAGLSLAEAELERAAAAAAAAARTLALRWGAGDAAFDSLVLPEPDLAPPPPADSVLGRIGTHPELERASSEAAVAEARARIARAERVPDVEARLGVRHLREAGGAGLVAGLAVPIPAWSRGAGPLAAARAEREEATLGVTATRRRLESDSRTALGRLRAAIAAYERIRDHAAPAAEEALAALQAAYRVGRLGYGDFAEGRRAALDTRLATIEAAAEVWRARATLDRLVGRLPTELEKGGER